MAVFNKKVYGYVSLCEIKKLFVQWLMNQI